MMPSTRLTSTLDLPGFIISWNPAINVSCEISADSAQLSGLWQRYPLHTHMIPLSQCCTVQINCSLICCMVDLRLVAAEQSQWQCYNAAVQFSLIPELDQSIPTSCCNFWCLMRMPQGTDAHSIVSLELVVQFLCLPVPDKQLTIRITRNQVAETTFTNDKITYW